LQAWGRLMKLGGLRFGGAAVIAADIVAHIVACLRPLITAGSGSSIRSSLCRAVASRALVRNIGLTQGGAMWATWVLVLFLVFSLALVHGRAIAGPLHDAAQAGDVEEVRELVAQGADVDERDVRGETPLIKAALAGQTAAAAVLIEAGADVGARNDRGFSGLHAAAYSGSVEIAAMLLDHGVPVDDRAGRDITPLHVAGEENQVAVADLLLDRGADRDALQASGYTPLTAATFMRGTDVMVLLKRRGAECAPPDFLGAGAHAECMAAGNPSTTGDVR
jgi:ankyrin repeat protein